MHAAIEELFSRRGWRPFEFQRQAWAAYLAGASGLIHAPTGTGKTQAAWLGPVMEFLQERGEGRRGARVERSEAEPLRVLWITPLRALAADTTRSIRQSVEDLGLLWTVEQRTGDTPQSVRAKQRERLPTALVTTPESLSLLLSYADAAERLAGVRCVVIDEWHELIGSKRGVQIELALARLRRFNPQVRTWGVSATLGNTEEAAQVLVGPRFDPRNFRIIRGHSEKKIELRTLLPDQIERFPWAGHLGTRLLAAVADTVEQAGTTLLFTNTRSQAEIWFRQLTLARPEWLGQIALHHGSLDRAIRAAVERRLDEAGSLPPGDPGRLRCVVCTSSLDLGVDFQPVDQVIQVGSPKGVARLLQRAGRSGHQPGAVSRLVGVPTHALELVEFAAAQQAVAAGRLESRVPVRLAFDVLAQHVVTVAAGGGFAEAELLEEVRSTHAYAGLTEAQWQWTLDFVKRGGPSLTAYPRYVRVAPAPGDPGTLAVASPAVARAHRLNVGTITADVAMSVRMVTGRMLGTIEEGFIARLRPGDRLVFAGRVLELVRVRENTALVRRAKGSGRVPSWDGGKMPLSSQLSAQVVEMISRAARGEYDLPEMLAVRPILELQQATSALPSPHELLIEITPLAGVWHTYVYPFAGRLVHEALAALLAHRLTRSRPLSVTAVSNDYGVEVLSPEPPDTSQAAWRGLLSGEDLLADLLASLNATQLARRQFREIARIAGLIHQGYPGSRIPSRQTQASSEMFFDVLSQFDPDNLLLHQAQRELIEGQLEVQRLRQTLEWVAGAGLRIVVTDRLSPLAFPLWAESLRSVHASGEQWADRVRSMVLELEHAEPPGRSGARSRSVPRRNRRRRAIARE